MKYENPDTTLEMLIGILKNKIPKLKEQYPEVHKQLGVIEDNLHRISLTLYDENTKTSSSCPFCGSTRTPTIQQIQGFAPRLGCLDCDKWWDKPTIIGKVL